MEIQRLSDREKLEVSLQLAMNTEFHWFDPKQTWAGFNQKQLISLTGSIANFIGITPDQAKKIKVVFGDHTGLENPVTGISVDTAAFCPINFRGDILDNSIVVLNRSLEVANRTIKGLKFDNDQIVCKIKNPQEFIVWIISEELKHAHVYHTAKSSTARIRWENNYLYYLEKNGYEFDHEYDNSLIEVSASRVTLQILKKLNPDRREYYQHLFNRSLEERRNVFPDVTKLINKTFVKTHYGRRMVTIG